MHQNIYVLDGNPHPPKWKMYSVPSEKLVKYSSLLKRKREFQQFIDQLGSQVSISNKMSSCYILDKIHYIACEKDINVYFFDGSEWCKSLHLKICVPKQCLNKKINLLIHLSSKNNAVSQLENLCMIIKCKEGQIWQTFYNFLEVLMKKSSINHIGTQFYVSLAFKCTIINELRFLHLLDNASASNPHFPFSLIQECVKNNVKPKESSKQKRGFTTCDMKTSLESSGEQKPLNSITLKRKSIESNSIRVKTLKVSHEFCRKLSCKCHERNKWKVFKRVTKHSIVNYTDLLKIEDAFDNSELSSSITIRSEKCPLPASLKEHQDNDKPCLKLKSIKEVELSSKSSLQVINIPSNMDFFEYENVQKENAIEKSCELYSTEKNKNITFNKGIKDTGNFLCQEIISDSQGKHKPNINNNKKYSQEITEKKQKTESLNSIPIKNEFKEIEPVKVALTSENDSSSLKMPSICFQSVSVKEPVANNKFPKGFQSISMNNSYKLNVSPLSFQTASGSKEVPGNVIKRQSIGFQTAAGKSVNVSEKAILAAQKMFEEVCSQETNVLEDDIDNSTLPNNPSFKKPAYPGENYLENEFNSDFAEKFFEEIPFDDKEIESKPEVNLMQSPFQNLNSGKHQVGKVRKSLGGRRSLKPYAIKK